eukprot:CAMPEP_0202342380 /NCGR_PEP_ID=MMETSP1126-20121109/2970_1 /ASSEMBLY_ACC=CAM_ASM_000457 /TAXON_ID=3047 /ORGANISM="Dunaliella tertiolecta, Strain CCMP1320" /LENGTH=36 /DNA_ID= /DNA_START= /DNA_END= /DNA_ORIENTATION=
MTFHLLVEKLPFQEEEEKNLLEICIQSESSTQDHTL